MTNKKRYISTFTRAIDPKLSKGVDLGWGNLTYKVTWHINHVVTRQIENVISLPSQGLWSLNLAGSWIGWENLIYKVTWRSITWSRVKSKCFISTFTRPMSPKTWIRMKGSHPIVTWHIHYVVTWKIKTVIFPQPQGRRDVKGKLVLVKNKHKNVNRMLNEVDRG